MMTYWEAVAIKELLIQKLNDGLFVADEWRGAIAELRASGFYTMAGDLQGRLENYQLTWQLPEQEPEGLPA